MADLIQELFASHGLRCTRQRKALYVSLCAIARHPTADELHRQVTAGEPGISLATVYNTLEALCGAGLVQKLPGAGDNGSARFDATPENHLHMRCQKTGSVADVPVELGEKILEHIPVDVLDQVESTLGFKINQVQIELVGKYEKSASR